MNFGLLKGSMCNLRRHLAKFVLLRLCLFLDHVDQEVPATRRQWGVVLEGILVEKLPHLVILLPKEPLGLVLD